MLVLRFVQGIAIGGALPVSVTYINELAPTKIRGRYFALYQVLCMSGYACAAVSSTWIVPHLGWRWLMGFGAAPLILLPLAWLTLPESPRWLARTGRLERANRALAKLGGAPAAFPDVVAAKADAPVIAKPTTLTLFSKEFRARTLTVTMLWALSLFANFGLTTWAPSIYFKVYHIPLERALQYGAAANILFLIFSPITGILIDKFGRRPLAIAGTLIAGVSLLALAGFRPTDEVSVVSLVIIGAVAISLTVLILWPVTAETFPTGVRALGMGYASAIGRGSSMITPVFVGWVLNKGAPISIVFAIFGLFCILAFTVWVFRVRETAGKPLDTV
jgi:putative MFS transporter